MGLAKGLFIVVIAIPVLAFLLQAIKGYIADQCERFDIDYSQAAGKTFVITGANSGLGFETALAIAAANGTVVMGCRSLTRCGEAQRQILSTYPHSNVDFLPLDLSSFDSVIEFSKQFINNYGSLDVLVNNAGIMALPSRELTDDGLEMQIGTNHFGHFLLTSLLYPIMKENGRIINHSSGAHSLADPSFPEVDLQSESYSPWRAYGNSKQANLLFTFELNRRLRRAGNPKKIISIAVHPGYSSTNLQVDRFPMWDIANNYFAMPAKYGALAQIYAAVDPRAQPSMNTYLGPKYLMVGAPAVQATSAASHVASKQQLLWEESERLTKTSFQI